MAVLSLEQPDPPVSKATRSILLALRGQRLINYSLLLHMENRVCPPHGPHV